MAVLLPLVINGKFGDVPAITPADIGKALTVNGGGTGYTYSAFATTAQITSAIGTHEAAGDPHPGYVLESAYTAADVLAKLLTVDGVGSGLDADLLAGWNVGTSANNIVKLDASARLPAVDGSQLTNLPSGVTDHGALTGLADDDHAQYALLAGRAGGTVQYGGTAANEDLTLRGTSHATKTTSYVLLQPDGGNVGVGLLAPAAKLEVQASIPANTVSGPSFMFSDATAGQNIPVIYSYKTGSSSGALALFGWNYYLDVGTGTYARINSAKNGWGFEMDARNSTNDSNFSIRTITSGGISLTRLTIDTGGLVAIGTHTPTALLDLAASTTARASLRVRDGTLPTAPDDGAIAKAVGFNFWGIDAGTNAIANMMLANRQSSGTPAAGFGAGFAVQLESSTTIDQIAGRLTYEWIVATHASRASRGKLSAYSTSTEQEAVRWDGDSGGVKLGFYGTAAVAQQVLATGAGATVDQVITALQNLGLLRQS